MPAALTRAARVAALVLLAWQAVFAQAHVHAGERPSARAATASTQWATGSHRPDPPLPCPVCREIAHVAHYLSPGPVLLAPPLGMAVSRTLATLPILRFQSPAQGWRSRAPPGLLHA